MDIRKVGEQIAFAEKGTILKCYTAEAIIQNLINGAYFDPADVKKSFKSDNFKNIVLEYCAKYGIK